MHNTYNDTINRELTRSLQSAIPNARAEACRLPDVPEIALYLLNCDYSSAELTPEQTRRIMDYPAYWSFCWASGQVLARYLLDHPGWVNGRHVLDFGCGSGVVAIAAALAGAAQVTACDLDPDALNATAHNAALNKVQLTLCSDFAHVTAPIDLIVVADVLYDAANLGWLSRFLQKAPEVLIADSRVKDFSAPNYAWIDRRRSRTWPDLDEFDEFREVNLYRGRATSVPATAT
ncbi:methyltransferase [Alkalilimnicola ehrlichii]|uniref:class I SAM-dependent methyltransferase n=1 Tax=Alkalilimnicola ehrlichii TaxID=351052 RepID=UPI002163A94A|nr:50S ribosomal protein L11 methyltransferase [Alkalilimnicola ehrlichii]